MHVARARVPEVVRGKSSSGFREWQTAQLCRGESMVVKSSEEGKKVESSEKGKKVESSEEGKKVE